MRKRGRKKEGRKSQEKSVIIREQIHEKKRKGKEVMERVDNDGKEGRKGKRKRQEELQNVN